jgi:hypothetical protein
MKIPSIFSVVLGLAGLAVSCLSGGLESALAQEEQGMSSKRALASLSSTVGEQARVRVVSMKGYGGVPQPDVWEVVCHDPNSPTLLHRYRIGGGYVRDEGLVEDAYPTREPAGFIDYAQLRLDSVGEFSIAEVAASQAKMGFDSVNLTLRCREYSREPVWILHLIDTNGLLVGKVHLSANSARVFRTIWIHRDDVRNGQPRIVDSALIPADELTQRLPQSTIDGAVPPLPGADRATSIPGPPPTIRIEPGVGNFVPPVPAPVPFGTEPEPTQILRDTPPPTIPRTNGAGLPPIPRELLQVPTVPDTRIPPPP